MFAVPDGVKHIKQNSEQLSYINLYALYGKFYRCAAD